MADDYRLTYPPAGAPKSHPFIVWLENNRPRGYVTGPEMPSDRQGLLASLHDRCCVTDEQVEWFHRLAKSIAKETGRRIYVTFTTSRWHLILLSTTDERGRLWYDQTELENGVRVYADDQFIGHYDPDGSFQVDGVS
jgi:hypothetical protein